MVFFLSQGHFNPQTGVQSRKRGLDFSAMSDLVIIIGSVLENFTAVKLKDVRESSVCMMLLYVMLLLYPPFEDSSRCARV